MHTRKPNAILISLVAIGVVVFAGYEGFGWQEFIDDFAVNSLIADNLKTEEDVAKDKVGKEAWQVLEEYLAYAKAHNLEGVKRLSLKISDTCANESKREECFALMDGAYAFISPFKASDFKNVLWDEYRVTLFTDYRSGTRTAIFFTRDTEGALKVAGVKFCFGDGSMPDECSSLEYTN